VSRLVHTAVSWELVAAEIAKCEVRCANCHRRRTAAVGGYYRAIAARMRPDSLTR
jgi:cytochrome c551/c552